MSRDWMLLETLGDEPTVIAIGLQARNMAPLESVLRRNRHRPLIETAIADCRRTGELTVAFTPARDRVVRVHPISMGKANVHGVQVWFGPADVEPPPRPVAGACLGDLDTSLTTLTAGYFEVMGFDPQNRSERQAIAEGLAPVLPSPRNAELMAHVVNPELDSTFCGTCLAADYQGHTLQVHYAGRASKEIDPAGAVARINRIVCTRVDNRPAEPRVGLAQQILDAVAAPGMHRMLLNVDTFAVLKWIDAPFPDLAWRYDPDRPENIHPDDEAAARNMRDELRAGATSGVLRVRAISGGWLRVHVSATKFALHDNAFAGLVTLTAAPAVDIEP
ncbi:GAF domain-containing protein [Mycobacteroides franklinii]|uniref:Rv3651-like N-terminal domain-containing protein n=2 Tax=Mycobacteroides franklinii TaxID=948102 RepID=A0A4R5PBM6_9MYCO|nr:GAF domain-containing protein [Mycobacteroides franklinii]ORA59081.1 hypothetical protein BST24_18945 [Mycobacteroides franklinii]TDH21744.1 hypothetical protein EJ571_07100 [Mycobacteroides franklinii]